MQCKSCNRELERESEIVGEGKYKYKTEGKYWHGRVCPGCVARDKQARRGVLVETKSCVQCGAGFSTTDKRKLTCSVQCKEKRRSIVSSNKRRAKRLAAKKVK